jgi:probable selenium-dependent hydroxylase accessory protein YqeC
MQVYGRGDASGTFSSALGLCRRELIAFVGAGGKTAALQRLALELADGDDKVAVSTTTAMFPHQLAFAGPLILMSDKQATLTMQVKQRLLEGRVVAVARLVDHSGKARGLSPAAVDALWRERIAAFVLVEADGSRGLPLKAFGTGEPQVPVEATTVVVVGGLDALGSPLDEAHVHRAGQLASILSLATDQVVTHHVFARALALQIARVRALWPRARVVVLLNKADTDEQAAAGLEIARVLDDELDAGAGRHVDPGRPHRLVVGSVSRGIFHVATAERV